MRTLIIDCNNISYIARHAFGETLSHDEGLTGILWGFFNQVRKLAEEFQTRKFLFAWDSRKSFRRREFPAYKANRRVKEEYKLKALDEQEEKIYAQFTSLRKNLLPAFGFKNIYMHTGLEADDIIASLVLGYEWDEAPVVVSTDKDMFQLLDYCDVWRPLPGEQKMLMTRGIFKVKFGLDPREWVRARSLEGDPSDNLGGLSGVGLKTAIKFMRATLSSESKHWEVINSEAGRAIMKRNVRLMTLPFPGTPKFPVVVSEVFKLDDFMSICDRYRFNHFLKLENLNAWRNLFAMEG